MDNPEIGGVEYQQGVLAGYEVREYLLEKWGRTCAYCGARDIPLQVEHIQPKARGGTDRVSNLCLACEPCNNAKGKQDVKVFLSNKPESLMHILSQAKAPLKDASAVNSTRWALFNRLKALGLPVECGSGGRTKFNRVSRGLSKKHWIDAVCVGKSTPGHVKVAHVVPLLITAKGHGHRRMCHTNKYGFPKQHRQRHKQYFGFQTGDMVKVTIPRGKYAGVYVTRITVRSRGAFESRLNGRNVSFNHKHCTALHHGDGYQYAYK